MCERPFSIFACGNANDMLTDWSVLALCRNSNVITVMSHFSSKYTSQRAKMLLINLLQVFAVTFQKYFNMKKI